MRALPCQRLSSRIPQMPREGARLTPRVRTGVSRPSLGIRRFRPACLNRAVSCVCLVTAVSCARCIWYAHNCITDFVSFLWLIAAFAPEECGCWNTRFSLMVVMTSLGSYWKRSLLAPACHPRPDASHLVLQNRCRGNDQILPGSPAHLVEQPRMLIFISQRRSAD